MEANVHKGYGERTCANLLRVSYIHVAKHGLSDFTGENSPQISQNEMCSGIELCLHSFVKL